MPHFRLKCTQFDFGWGTAPRPQTPLGELTAFHIVGLVILLLRGGEARRRGRERRERKVR